MIEFRVLKQSGRSRARLGVLRTPHGEVETPALVPVATQAAVKTLSSDEVLATKTRILIANTFHLHLKPGEAVVRRAGGLHKFMNWPRPLMTDSGGFQVFSLGFGKEFGVGKVLKQRSVSEVKVGQQPKLLKITEDGVWFTSYLDGRKIFLGPRESMRIQEALGADIMFAFDECPPPIADRGYVKKSLELTHRWAERCLELRKSKKALYGIVQGGRFKDLRRESARVVGKLGFEGFGIGGEFGGEKDTMVKLLGWTFDVLPQSKPRHLLGIGHPEDIPKIVRAGVDTFDCIVPTHYARHGIAFTGKGRLDMMKSAFLRERKPLDLSCACAVCESYTRSYISHLIRAREITGMKLLTIHNLHFFNSYIEKLREDIKRGKL